MSILLKIGFIKILKIDFDALFIRSQFSDPIDSRTVSFDLFSFSFIHKFKIVQIPPSV